MAKQVRKVRDKGKIKLSSYFKKIEDGVNVAIVTDAGIKCSYPKRIRGLSGKVVGSRGKFKEVQIKDGGKMKTFVVHPIHLRRL